MKKTCLLGSGSVVALHAVHFLISHLLALPTAGRVVCYAGFFDDFAFIYLLVRGRDVSRCVASWFVVATAGSGDLTGEY